MIKENNNISHFLASGLPELTNRGGEPCRDSNPIQAWSMATLLDTLYDIKEKHIKI